MILWKLKSNLIIKKLKSALIHLLRSKETFLWKRFWRKLTNVLIKNLLIFIRINFVSCSCGCVDFLNIPRNILFLLNTVGACNHTHLTHEAWGQRDIATPLTAFSKNETPNPTSPFTLHLDFRLIPFKKFCRHLSSNHRINVVSFCLQFSFIVLIRCNNCVAQV